MKVPFFELNSQFRLIEHEIRQTLDELFMTQQFILGPKVEEFENVIAQYCQTKFAIGVASGSDAILLSLMALGIGSGDEVIIPSFTFFATAGSVSRTGAIPVFVDIDPNTYNIDPSKIEEKITSKTKAIIPVHLFGQCADMKPILEIAKNRNLFVIEDAAQAIGAEYRPDSKNEGKKAGQMGDLGCFSFYPTKNLGGFGDGGMVVTNNPKLAEKIRLLRVHGSSTKYFHKFIGINSRLDAIQAAILLVKFKYLERWIVERQNKAKFYNLLFNEQYPIIEQIKLPYIQYNNRHIFHQYVIRVPERNKLREFLAKEGVGTDIYYPLPLHLQECYSFLKYKRGDLPISERTSDETLALPIYPELTEEQQIWVVDRIKKFFQNLN
jgi:dTDP-4-amino-4,6-dideoxygalactose transaminase